MASEVPAEFMEPHRVRLTEPTEEREMKPVQMRYPEGSVRPQEVRGPRVSMVSRPPTVRTSTVYQKPAAFWKQFDMSEYMQSRMVHPLAWTTFAFLLISLLLLLVMFAAPGWAKTLEIRAQDSFFEGEMNGYYGIWYACWTLLERPDGYEFGVRTDCELLADLRTVPAWMKGAQAVLSLALFSCAASLCSVGAYIFSKVQNEKKVVIGASAVFSLASGVCCAILFIVYCLSFLRQAKWCCVAQAQVVTWELSYCFMLCCINTVVFWAAAITGWMEIRRLRKIERKKAYFEEVYNTRAPGLGYH